MFSLIFKTVDMRNMTCDILRLFSNLNRVLSDTFTKLLTSVKGIKVTDIVIQIPRNRQRFPFFYLKKPECFRKDRQNWYFEQIAFLLDGEVYFRHFQSAVKFFPIHPLCTLNLLMFPLVHGREEPTHITKIHFVITE